MVKKMAGFLFSLFLLVFLVPAVALAWDYDKDDGEKLSVKRIDDILILCLGFTKVERYTIFGGAFKPPG